MVEGLIGKKIGMTEVFDEAGNAVPVTVIQAGPCVVVQKKVLDKDGYSAVQLGFVEPGRKVKANRPLEGHFKRAGVPPARVLKEFRLSEEGEEAVEVGSQVLAQDVFEVNDIVHVTGRSKGRGFQGVVKRHGFGGGRATHGSMFHRAPGSIGASAFPSRVLPGMRGPGRMGGKQVKVRGLRVVAIDQDNNLVLVKGSVPGSRGSYVYLTRAN
ncbi:MAG TPA: 50S ribosomal protein L3 [Acidobacteriota bacterium]|nr:50S ribosomal protein L3 [Acidobacteriota bacterium]